MNVNTEVIRRLRDSLLLRERTAQPDVAPITGAQKQGAPRDALLRRIEPFAETMYLVMMADAESAEVERRALLGALSVLTDGTVDPAELNCMIDRFDAGTAREGSEARLQQIGMHFASEREDRETAFTLAAVVAVADERVEPGENRVLEWVQEYFGVSDRRAQILLESID